MSTNKPSIDQVIIEIALVWYFENNRVKFQLTFTQNLYPAFKALKFPRHFQGPQKVFLFFEEKFKNEKYTGKWPRN